MYDIHIYVYITCILYVCLYTVPVRRRCFYFFFFLSLKLSTRPKHTGKKRVFLYVGTWINKRCIVDIVNSVERKFCLVRGVNKSMTKKKKNRKKREKKKRARVSAKVSYIKRVRTFVVNGCRHLQIRSVWFSLIEMYEFIDAHTVCCVTYFAAYTSRKSACNVKSIRVRPQLVSTPLRHKKVCRFIKKLQRLPWKSRYRTRVWERIPRTRFGVEKNNFQLGLVLKCNIF